MPAIGETSEDRGTADCSRRGALAAMSLSVLLSSLGTSSANAVLPVLAGSFQVSFHQVQWVVLAYLVAMTSSLVAAGRLGDILGRRRLLIAGLMLFASSSAACALAPALWVLIAARAAQGIGAAMMAGLGMAFVADTIPKERTGRAMGFLGTMSAVGTALGPSVGGVLVDALGWRALFAVNLPLGLTAAWLALRCLPRDPEGPAPKARFDATGATVLVVTLAAYALAATGGRSQAGWATIFLATLAAGGTWLFLRVEARAASPLIDLASLRQPQLGFPLVANLLVSAVMMTTLVVGPFYLSSSLGLSVAAVGMVMATGPVVSALTGIVAGRAVDRVGAVNAVLAGLVAMACGTLALAIVPATLGWPGYVGALVVLTPGYQLFQAGNNTSVMVGVPAGRRGVVSGVLNLSRSLGLITGATLMGDLFSLASGPGDVAVASPQAVADATRLTFLAAAGLAGAALIMTRLHQNRPASGATGLGELPSSPTSG